MATTVALLVLYGLYDDSGQPQFSNGVAALYNATHRTAWAAAVCWVIIACATGHGGKWPLMCFFLLRIWRVLQVFLEMIIRNAQGVPQ